MLSATFRASLFPPGLRHRSLQCTRSASARPGYADRPIRPTGIDEIGFGNGYRALQDSIDETLRRGGYLLDGVATITEFCAASRQIAYGRLIIDLALHEDDGPQLIPELGSENCANHNPRD